MSTRAVNKECEAIVCLHSCFTELATSLQHVACLWMSPSLSQPVWTHKQMVSLHDCRMCWYNFKLCKDYFLSFIFILIFLSDYQVSDDTSRVWLCTSFGNDRKQTYLLAVFCLLNLFIYVCIRNKYNIIQFKQ